MNTMKWPSLMLAARLYAEQETYDRLYRKYLDDEHGPSFWATGAPTIEQANRVLLFANQWGSRVRRSEDDVQRLHRALHGAKSALAGLRDARLETIDLTPAERSAIQQGFDLILDSLARNSATATSKILHMFNRSLFVMWDKSIRHAYGVGDGVDGEYGHKFLPRTQREVLAALEAVVDEGLAEEQGASIWLREQTEHDSLAKLIDEFNYCKFTAGMDEIWSVA